MKNHSSSSPTAEINFFSLDRIIRLGCQPDSSISRCSFKFPVRRRKRRRPWRDSIRATRSSPGRMRTRQSPHDPNLHAMRNPVGSRRMNERLTMRCERLKRNFPSMLRIFAIGRRPNRGRTLVHSGRSDRRRLRTAPVNEPDRATLSSFPRLPRSKPADDAGSFARRPTANGGKPVEALPNGFQRPFEPLSNGRFPARPLEA